MKVAKNCIIDRSLIKAIFMKIPKGVEARTLNLKGLISRSLNRNPGDYWSLAFIGIGSFPISYGSSTRYEKSGTLIRTMLVNRSMTDEKT